MPGATRSNQSRLEAARSSQKQPEAARSTQEQSEASRSSQKQSNQPGAASSNQKQTEAQSNVYIWLPENSGEHKNEQVCIIDGFAACEQVYIF